MTTGLLTTTVGRNAIIADLGGGADLVLTHVAWGDANGVPYNPNEAQVALVNEKYRATIASVAVVGGAIVVDAVIPADTNDGTGRPSHGFSVAEVGLFSSAGTLIGVARCGNGYKPPPSSGQAHDVTYRLKLAVANPSAITVVIDPVAQISVGRHVRPFWLTVDGVLNDPPGAPAAGVTYIVGPAPTGAWVGFAHRVAQWVGVWALATVPVGHVVVDNSKGRYAGNRWLERTAAGWDAGLTRLVQRQPGNYAVAAGTANSLTVALDPAPADWADLVGVPLTVLLTATNTGPATLAITGLPTGKPIRHPPNVPLTEGELQAGAFATVFYDGTQVQYVGARPRVLTPLFYDEDGILNVVPTAPLIPREPEILTVSGTHTFTEDGFYDITLIGGAGGGSGGYGSSNFTAGGNGGGSGYVRRFTRFYAAGTTISFTVGAGGSGGSANIGGAAAGPGMDGGATTFDGVTAMYGKGATAAVLATVDTGVEGAGRNNGVHGNYIIGPDASSVQMVPGQGGRGFLDTKNYGTAYGEGGRGGLGANNVGYITSGVSGLSGAVVIE